MFSRILEKISLSKNEISRAENSLYVLYTYTCERTFSKMKNIKSKPRSRLTDDNLRNLILVSISSIEPDLISLVNVKECHVSNAT